MQDLKLELQCGYLQCCQSSMPALCSYCLEHIFNALLHIATNMIGQTDNDIWYQSGSD